MPNCLAALAAGKHFFHRAFAVYVPRSVQVDLLEQLRWLFTSILAAENLPHSFENPGSVSYCPLNAAICFGAHYLLLTLPSFSPMKFAAGLTVLATLATQVAAHTRVW